MELHVIQRIAKAWVANRRKYGEAWEELDSMCLDRPADALRTIEEIHHHITELTPVDYELMGLLAAGPLEDLLVRNGDKVIDRIEELARNDAEFRKCLTGVWRNSISHELFARVQKAADRSFKL